MTKMHRSSRSICRLAMAAIAFFAMARQSTAQGVAAPPATERAAADLHPFPHRVPAPFAFAAKPRPTDTPLRFPGKVLADEPGGRLFIADSNHNRIVVADLAGKVQAVIGSGKVGHDDAAIGANATFNEPAGITADDGKLYVADTNNHAIRVVELVPPHRVTTLVIDLPANR